MRTTLTVDDSLLEELKALAARERRPFRQVVEECLLTGLRQRDQRLGEAAAVYRVAAHPAGPAPGIDLLAFNRLADEVDDRA